MEDFNHFSPLADKFARAISQAVRKTAFVIQSSAASSAPVDTGFLKNSIYVVTSDDSSYGSGGSSGKKDSYLLPEVAKAENKYTAYVAVGANYGIYQEFGTRFMPAQPYFYPAIDAAAAPFEQVIAAIEQEMQ